MSTYTLKPGQDTYVGDPNTTNTVFGTLTAAIINQTGPTLNSNDILTGGTNSYNQLVISDDYGLGADILPAGLQISNFQEIDLNTAGNAGGSVAGLNGVFDTRAVSGDVLDVVKSSGNGNDNVAAAKATIIEVSHSSLQGGVSTTGGQAVGISTAGNGGVVVGGVGLYSPVPGASSLQLAASPTGDVVVQDSGIGTVNKPLYDLVNGGNNVTVFAAGANQTVDIGVALADGNTLTAPTGTIGVSAALGDKVDIGGGNAVGVAAAGANVSIGKDGPSPTGDVAVTNFEKTTYNGMSPNYATSVNGGNNVTVYTNAGDVTLTNSNGNVTVGEASASGIVMIGSGANVAVSAFGGPVSVGSIVNNVVTAPTGLVTVLDQGAVFDDVLNTTNNTVSVLGGSSVVVQTAVGSVTVGNASGLAGANTTGNVTVVDAATGLAAVSYVGGVGSDAVDVYGGNNVTIIALGGNIQVGGGKAAALATDPTGTVSIDNAGQATGGVYGNHIDVYGGNGIGIITNGGSVTVGQDGAEAQGSVGIIDNFSGPNVDSFTVVGGSTISVTTTALQNSQSITIGDVMPQVGAAGNVLSNAAAFATGNVNVVNETVIGGNAYLGDGSTTINTNGATFVSVTGGNGAFITDVETTQGTGAFAGSTIGTSTLSSVALNGVEGNVTITSDALAQLAIANTGGLDNFYDATAEVGTASRGTTNVIVTETPAHSLALALANDVGLSVTDGTATAINVTTVGTNPVVGGTVVAQGNDFQLTAGNATSLSFAGAGNVVLDAGSVIGKVATITATGSGAVNLGNLTADLKLTSIDASAASGAVSVEINPNQTSFAGGSGNDVVTVDSNNFIKAGGGFNTVNGGTGNNTIVANYVAAPGDTALALLAPSFQTLQLGANASSAVPANVYNATGFSNIVDASTHNVIVTNASTSATVGFGVSSASLAYNLAQPAGMNNSLTVNDGGFTGNTLDLTGDGISTVTVNSTTTNPTSMTPAAGLILKGAAGLSTVTLTGNTAVSLAISGTPESVTKVDASAATGKVDVSALMTSDAYSHSGVSITGGSALLTAGGVSDAFGSVSSANDVLTTGSGGGALTLGFGGEWTPSLVGYGTGSETVNLTASTGKVDKIVVTEGNQGVISSFNGTKGGVTGFQVTANSTTSDQFNYAYTKKVIANTTTATSVTSIAGSPSVQPPAGLTFTSSNGVITFSATAGGNVDSAFTQAQLVAAAELIVDAQGTDEIATFQSAGNTYVVASGHQTQTFLGFPVGAEPTFNHNYNSVVELLGVTGVTGFGSTVGTAAGNAILGNVTQALYTPAMSGPVNATGYSEVSLANASGSTPITGLGASGQIDITTASPGAITVSQVGTAGADSLIVNFTTGSTVSSLTLNSDNAVTISAKGTDVISKLVDGAGTLSTIDVTGTGNVTIGNFSTPGLTTIDAHMASGNLTIGSGATALASNGVHITGGSGALDTFYVNGANLVIDDHLAGSTFLSAFGSGDTIKAGALTGPGTDVAFGGSAALVSGNNEAITFNSGHLVAGGSNDQVTFSGAGAGFATVGSNATVTVSNAGLDSISVTGDVTGATSSGAFSFTTINPPAAPTTGATAAQTHASINPTLLTINFNSTGMANPESAAGGTNFAASLVNVAGLSSLGAAVDFAAHQALVLDHQNLFGGAGGNTTVTSGSTPVLQENAKTGLVDWFQYAGNTYIVEAVNNTSAAAAHAALGTGDVVVKLTGLVDLSNTHFSGHALHA